MAPQRVSGEDHRRLALALLALALSFGALARSLSLPPFLSLFLSLSLWFSLALSPILSLSHRKERLEKRVAGGERLGDQRIAARLARRSIPFSIFQG